MGLNSVISNFNHRQMILIESATTPHSFNSLLLLLLPLAQNPNIVNSNAFYYFYRENQFMGRSFCFLYVELGSFCLQAPGVQILWSGAKKKICFSPPLGP